MAIEPVEKEFWSLCAQCFVIPSSDESAPSETTPKCGMEVMAAHRVSYLEWEGKGDGRTLVCVHGVFRNSWDFYFLAQHLAERGWRVVSPDLPGRGRSEKLPTGAFYTLQQYALDCAALLARLDVDRVSWLGTSLGGLIGMKLAGQANSPIERLILNDVGTEPLSATARDHIRAYAAADPSFDTIEELEVYLRMIYAAFGDLTDAQWRHLAEHSRWEKADGKLGLAYHLDVGQQVIEDMGTLDDPDVVNVFRTYWQETWKKVKCPVLILNGTESLVLSAAAAAVMATKDGVTLERFAGCGHAPALMNDKQIAVVRDWLDGT